MSIANTQAETIIQAGIIDDNDQVMARIEHLKALEVLVGNSYPNKFERSRITGKEDTISNILAFAPVAEIAKQLRDNTPEGEKPDQELKAQLNEKLKEFGNVRVSGRLAVPPRVMGKAAFVHLSDGISRLQIYVRRDAAKAVFNGVKSEPSAVADGSSALSEPFAVADGFSSTSESSNNKLKPPATADGSDKTSSPATADGADLSGWDVFKLLDHGDFIGAEGYLFLTNTGELSVHVETFQFLSKALLPMPDKMHGIADPELQRRYRYADLIASSLQVEHEGLTTREVFERRAKLISGMRRFLDDAGYIEVETPMLTPKATGAAATPFETWHNALDIKLYARIAPELYLKRLTVGGFEKVYELNRNFRNEGLSMKHNPEFTMLEFYCAYMDVNGMMDFAETMIKESVKKATGGGLQVKYGENEIDFSKFERLSMKDAIAKYWWSQENKNLSFVPTDMSEMTRGKFERSWLDDPQQVFYIAAFCNDSLLWDYFLPNSAKANVKSRGNELVYVAIEYPNAAEEITQQFIEKLNQKSNDSNEVKMQKCLVEIFETLTESNLIQPTFIIDYPKSISPLSKASPENPQIAERFELFMSGMEVANGFSELNDPQEQFERFVEQGKERESGDHEAMILDEDYIRALAYGMPPAAGIGIGIDRLVMLLTNKHSIRDVILFPHMRPVSKEEAANASGGEAETES